MVPKQRIVDKLEMRNLSAFTELAAVIASTRGKEFLQLTRLFVGVVVLDGESVISSEDVDDSGVVSWRLPAVENAFCLPHSPTKSRVHKGWLGPLSVRVVPSDPDQCQPVSH